MSDTAHVAPQRYPPNYEPPPAVPSRKRRRAWAAGAGLVLAVGLGFGIGYAVHPADPAWGSELTGTWSGHETDGNNSITWTGTETFSPGGAYKVSGTFAYPQEKKAVAGATVTGQWAKVRDGEFIIVEPGNRGLGAVTYYQLSDGGRTMTTHEGNAQYPQTYTYTKQ